MKINKLIPNPKNPRKITQNSLDRLKRKIVEFPQYIHEDPPIIDENNVILSGNQRYRACKELGWKDIPIKRYTREHAILNNTKRQVQGLKAISYEDQCDEIVIAKNSSFGEYDWDIAVEFALELFEDYGVEVPKDLDEVKSTKDIPNEGEVEFSDELLLEHNYIVLYFENALDWEVAKEKYGIKRVKTNTPKKSQNIGLGRVVKGSDFI